MPIIMTLVELRYLVAVASEKHFGRAARACHVSQPSLSTAIKNLEEELGVLLVERASSGIRLTPSGERVVTQAQRVLDEAARVAVVARKRAAPLCGAFRLGAIASLAPFAMKGLLVPLMRAHPSLSLVLREGLTQELLGRLRQGDLDAVLLALPISGTDLTSEAVFDEPFLGLLPASSPLANRKSVTPKDLAAGNLILLTEGHCFRDQALDVCRGHLALEEPARDQLAATSLHTIWRMVESGMGCTLMPQLAIDDVTRGSRGVVARPLGKPAPYRRIAVTWRAGSAAAEDARALAGYLRTHLPAGLLAASVP